MEGMRLGVLQKSVAASGGTETIGVQSRVDKYRTGSGSDRVSGLN